MGRAILWQEVAILAACGLLIWGLGQLGQPEVEAKASRQYDTQWSAHVEQLHTLCSFAAFIEHESAFIQGGTPEQAKELADGVYLECINTNQIVI